MIPPRHAQLCWGISMIALGTAVVPGSSPGRPISSFHLQKREPDERGLRTEQSGVSLPGSRKSLCTKGQRSLWHPSKIVVLLWTFVHSCAGLRISGQAHFYNMNNTFFYHYVTERKFKDVIERKLLVPSSPFNSKVPEKEWQDYARQFSFPVARLNTCCFFEPNPEKWREYGLFDLLMEEFSGGDHLLELTVSDEEKAPILVRDHSFHSPKKYDMLPQEWRKREKRDSRPELREAWYQSTTPLRAYDGSFICPEALIPYPISLNKIRVISK